MVALLVPLAKFAVVLESTPIEEEIAVGFNKIVAISGKNKPYEPESGVYPPPEIPEPFDPDTIWYTLDEPKKVWRATSFELSEEPIRYIAQ